MDLGHSIIKEILNKMELLWKTNENPPRKIPPLISGPGSFYQEILNKMKLIWKTNENRPRRIPPTSGHG